MDDNQISLVIRTSYRIMCDRMESERITVSVFRSACGRRKNSSAVISDRILLAETVRLCRIRLLKNHILTIFSPDSNLFVASSPTSPSADEYIARQAWQVFCRASRNCTDRQRIVYTLFELENLDLRYVSEITGYSYGAIEYSLERARASVKEQLDHYGRMDDYDSYVGFIRQVKDQLTDNMALKRQISDFICR